MEQFLSAASFIALYGVSYGVILFTISIGLVLTLGLMRVVNLAHGAFAAIGGYLSVTLMNQLALPFALAVFVAAVAVAAFSVLIERLCYAPLYAASELDQVLMTIGLMFVATAGLNFIFGPDVVPARLPPALAANVDLGVRTFQVYRLFIVALGAVLMVVLSLLFERSSFGARLRAAVDNRGMAEAVGIDVSRLFSLTFALGSGLAALGGAVGYAMLPLEPLYPFKYLTLVLIVVVLSGLVNIKASAGVAILVGVVDTAGRYLFPAIGAFVVYVVLIALLIWRSEGLFVERAAR